MAFSTNSGGGGPMADINVTPLVDVMLVLLIIFMITAPLMTHKIKVELPKASLNEKPTQKVAPVTVTVKANGEIYWADAKVSQDAFEAKLDGIIGMDPQPELDIRADRDTKYKLIEKTTTTAKSRGVRKVGFVSTRER
ncbi:MAG: biopolymer transporter ExbD [Arenimonas sp.]